MSRQRTKKGRPISGWVVLDKPEGIGSTQCVAKIKWLYKAAKAGHAGTLDPLASGMLPIALGEATRTVPHIMDGQKVYRFSVTWGIETNTDDSEGKAVDTSPQRPDEASIRAILPAFTGEIEQTPPAFSAVKINGERAYKLARSGEAVEIQSRQVDIERIALLSTTLDTADFEIACGKGTYVRALARDFGRVLGCFGHVSKLRRLSVGLFGEADLVSLETLAALEGDLNALDAELFATGVALDDLPEIAVSGNQVHRLRLGNPILLRGRDAIAHAEEAYVTHGNELIALGAVEKGMFKPKRVFRSSYV